MLKCGLVLEGGGMRGIYTAGVLDVLGERGITFDGVAGVSAGAIHAASFLAGQNGRSIRFYLAYCKDPRFMGIRSLLRTGDFVNNDFCYRQIPDARVPLDYDAVENNPASFYAVATDIETGKPHYMDIKSLRGGGMDALRASASLPLVSKFVSYDGKKLLDGGTSDSIPIDFMMDSGYEKCVIVLTQIDGYRKKPEKNALCRIRYRNRPDYLHAMETRHERYNAILDKIRALETENRVFVFRPSEKIRIRRLERDPARILSMYELGRRDAQKRFADLRSFLNGSEET